MCTAYPPLGRHSVKGGFAEAEEAKGGAEGGFAENGFTEGAADGVVDGVADGVADSVAEGRILEGVAEEGINKNEGLKKRYDLDGGVRRSVVVAVDEGAAEVIVAEAVLTGEDATENGEGPAEGGGGNGGDNI